MDPNWSHLPSLSALRAFDATARGGTFAEAARTLNVTHAAVAQQVRGLEADLGLKLTERAGRSIRLTPAGLQLAAALRDGFGRIATGVDAVQRVEHARGLRVSATPGIASKVLLPKLAGFWDQHPDIPVTIVPDRRSVDLEAEGFDLGIRALELDKPTPNTNAEELVRCVFVVVAAPALFANGPPNPLTAPWFTRDPFELGLLQRAGFDVDALNFREIGPPQLEPAAARMGYGLMICPEIMARSDLRAGELRIVPMPPLGDMAYLAVTPKGLLRPQVRTYIDWLKDEMKA